MGGRDDESGFASFTNILIGAKRIVLREINIKGAIRAATMDLALVTRVLFVALLYALLSLIIKIVKPIYEVMRNMGKKRWNRALNGQAKAEHHPLLKESYQYHP